jgi:hypothetical protein
MPVHIVKKLLDCYVAACTTKDKEGNTPLHSAVEVLDVNVSDVVEMLVKADSAGEGVKLKDTDGQYPLDSAVNRYVNDAGHGSAYVKLCARMLVAIQSLIKADRITAFQWRMSCRPILQRVFDGNHCDEKLVDLIKLIAPLDRDTIMKKYSHGRRNYPTLVHYAVCCGSKSMALALLQVNGDAAKHVDESSGRCLLHSVLDLGVAHYDTLVMLVELYPDALTTQDKQGNLPIHVAAAKKSTPADYCTVMLKMKNAKDTAKVENGSKKIPLRVAYEAGADDAVIKVITEAWPDAQEFMFNKKR